MTITLSLTPVRRSLIAIIGALSAAGLGGELYLHWSANPDPSRVEWATWLSLSYEGNLPTWFASCQLFACGCVLALLWAIARSVGSSSRRTPRRSC